MPRLSPTVAVLALMLGACQAGGEPAQPGEAAASPAPDPRAAPSQPGDAAAPARTSAPPVADECGADKLGRWLNILLTETVRADISEAIGHDRIRYIGPGDAVTLDHRLDRLNVETGTDGRVKRFRCG